MGPRVAWVLAAATAVLVVADAAVTVQYRSLTSEAAVAVHGFPFIPGAVLGSAVMGALVVTRDRRQLIGWLLVVLGTAGATSITLEAYSVWVLDHDGPGSTVGAGISGWLSSLLGGQLAITGIVFLFLLVPDGRLLTPTWRVAAAVAAVGEVLIVLGLLATDPRTFDLNGQRHGDGEVVRLLNTVGFLMISTALVAALVSMVLRLRRSHGVERQQLRVVALSAAAVCAGTTWLLVIEAMTDRPQTYVTVLPLFASYLLLPVGFAVAVLRYRLYDVDVIVNRTLVLALGTGITGLGYVVLVVLVSNVVDSRTSGYGPSLFATALVAIAFQPLRRTVVATANRLAFGARAQPYEALAEFSRRLGETPSAETVLSTVADAAGRAVSAQGATASLETSDLPRISASWGSDRAGTVRQHRVVVEEAGVPLGTIEVSIPPGRPLRSADTVLLRAIADQAAVAFRNLAMEAQLRDHVLAMDRSTEELSCSRTRIIEADDAARQSLAAGIASEVLPRLTAIAERLDRHADVRAMSARRIDDMVIDVDLALGSLRELTHGVFPAQLARSGLEPALRSYVRRRGLASVLEIAPAAVGRRFEPRVEAAVYFAATRALGAGPSPEAVSLLVEAGELRCTVGGSDPAPLDLQEIRDRAAAVGGTLRLGRGSLEVRVPLAATSPVEASSVGGGPGG